MNQTLFHFNHFVDMLLLCLLKFPEAVVMVPLVLFNTLVLFFSHSFFEFLLSGLTV